MMRKPAAATAFEPLPDELSTEKPSGVRAAEIENQRQRGQSWIAEEEWKWCQKWLFFPVSPLKQAFDFAIMILVVYASISAPYRATFEEAEGRWHLFETVVQLIFCVDVALSFNTAYLEEGRWVISRERIARHYLSSWFWIDFPSAIPLELISVYLERTMDKALIDDEHDGFSHILPMMRLIRLFRLIRLLRLLRLAEAIDRVEVTYGIDLSALRMLNTVIMLLGFCHVLACIFYVTANADKSAEKTWITFYDNGYLEREGTPIFDAYIIAYFWAMGLVCGQNTNVTPESMLDRVVSILVYLFATLFFAYIIAVVTNQLNSYVNDPRARALENLKTFTRFYGIPQAGSGSLGERMKTYYQKYYASRSMVPEGEIINNLTPSLRDEVMDHLLANTVRLCPLLHPPGVPEERLQKFQECVYQQIKPVSYAPKVSILLKGGHTDDLYFLIKGQVHAVTTAGDRGVRMLFPIYACGAFFGEQCLLNEANEVSYAAELRSEVLCVPKETLIEAAKLLASSERKALVEHVWADILHKAFLRIWGVRIVLADIIEANNSAGGAHGWRPILADPCAAALTIQLWYLRVALTRLRTKTAAQMLTSLTQGVEDAPSAPPSQGVAAPTDLAMMSQKMDAVASKMELMMTHVTTELGAISKACSVVASRVDAFDAKVRTLDKAEALETRIGSVAASVEKVSKGLGEVMSKLDTLAIMPARLPVPNPPTARSSETPSGPSTATRMASQRINRSQDRTRASKLGASEDATPK